MSRLGHSAVEDQCPLEEAVRLNTGPMIPTGPFTRLFQRLSSHAGPSAERVGLGLAIVQAIADAHGATVTARARTGGGPGIDVAFPALD